MRAERTIRTSTILGLILPLGAWGAETAAERAKSSGPRALPAVRVQATLPEAPEPAEADEESMPDQSNADIWMIVRAVREGRETRVALLTKSGTQANVKVRDEEAGVDVSANLLPAVNPSKPDQVDFQYQVELTDHDSKKKGFTAQGEAETKAGRPETLFEAGKDKLTVEVHIQPN